VANTFLKARAFEMRKMVEALLKEATGDEDSPFFILVVHRTQVHALQKIHKINTAMYSSKLLSEH
jgi:hypothetical protein